MKAYEYPEIEVMLLITENVTFGDFEEEENETSPF